MSEPTPPTVVHQNGGVVKIAGGVVEAVKTLPPTLLLIILLNVAMCLAAGWFLTSQEGHRAELVRLMLERCLVKGG